LDIGSQSVDLVARFIAIGGLILGSVGTVVSTATYFRDRPHLSVSLARKMQIVYGDGGAAEAVFEELEAAQEWPGAPQMPREIALRDPRKVWAFVTVINDGRRPVTFAKAGVYVPGPKPWCVALDSEIKLLSEGDHTEVQVDEEQLKRLSVLCAFARDIKGKTYFSPIPWTWSGIVFRVCRLWRRPP
jgi:hypothetical protein